MCVGVFVPMAGILSGYDTIMNVRFSREICVLILTIGHCWILEKNRFKSIDKSYSVFSSFKLFELLFEYSKSKSQFFVYTFSYIDIKSSTNIVFSAYELMWHF